VAEEAGISADDNFRLLAACGKDLPGAVTAEWEDIGRDALQALITQRQDALEATVWAEPFQDAISISGVQPKLGVNKTPSGRFVGRTRHEDTAIIAKLPSAEYPRMPQVEDLCMRLAGLAGVDICDIELAGMNTLGAGHRYDLGAEAQGHFLAVTRFDRRGQGRVHFEDFAQVLGVSPENKYSLSYAQIALTLFDLPGCGIPAVHELLRRIEVNELLGNADMHLKNLGLVYPDQKTARLAPAYDILCTHVYLGTQGHALAFLDDSEKPARHPRVPLLNPRAMLRFCNAVGIEVKLATQVVRDVARKAAATWLAPIQQADITPRQRQLLIDRLTRHPHTRPYFKGAAD
ncbi:MAG: type II toxin-antitoxin system HipA family toxin, partial [Haliea sp.]